MPIHCKEFGGAQRDFTYHTSNLYSNTGNIGTIEFPCFSLQSEQRAIRLGEVLRDGPCTRCTSYMLIMERHCEAKWVLRTAEIWETLGFGMST